MKKIIGLVASIVILITLSACGNEKTKTFVGKKDNVKVEVTYTYKGDRIIKQKSVSNLKYSDFGISDDTSKKRVKEAIERQSEKMQDVNVLHFFTLSLYCFLNSFFRCIIRNTKITIFQITYRFLFNYSVPFICISYLHFHIIFFPNKCFSFFIPTSR